MAAVRDTVKAMLGARSWTGSNTLAALQAQLSMKGRSLSEASIIRVSSSQPNTQSQKPKTNIISFQMIYVQI